MNNHRPASRPRLALPNYLYGFRRYCSLWLNPFERGVFATLERNRVCGHNVRLYYNQTQTRTDSEFLSRLVSYVWWLDRLRHSNGLDSKVCPLSIAVVTSRRECGERFATRLPGQVKVYPPRALRSAPGRQFDIVFILDAHLLGRCYSDNHYYTYFEKALSVFCVVPYLFVLGRHNTRSRLARSFHLCYRRVRQIQQEEPCMYSAFSSTDPVPTDSGTNTLPIGYEYPELAAPLERVMMRYADEYPDDDDDGEIVLGYQVGLDSEPPRRSAVPLSVA